MPARDSATATPPQPAIQPQPMEPALQMQWAQMAQQALMMWQAQVQQIQQAYEAEVAPPEDHRRAGEHRLWRRLDTINADISFEDRPPALGGLPPPPRLRRRYVARRRSARLVSLRLHRRRQALYPALRPTRKGSVGPRSPRASDLRVLDPRQQRPLALRRSPRHAPAQDEVSSASQEDRHPLSPAAFLRTRFV